MQLIAKSRPSPSQLGLGIAICLGAGIVGSLFTFSALRDWYPGLIKPPHTPPDSFFGPVWTLLYVLMGISLAYLWAATSQPQRQKRVLNWFWAQLGLNVAWSITFFGLRSPSWGYIIIIALWLAILGLLWTGSKLSRVAALLLVPYFLWVTYASALNFGILSLNVIKPRVEKMDADPRNDDKDYEVSKPPANE